MNSHNLKYLLPIRCIIFIAVFCCVSLITKQELSSFSNWWSPVASIVNILLIALLLFLCKKSGITFAKLINYQKGKTKGFEVFILTMLILMVGMSGMYIAGFICYGVIPYAAPMMIAPVPLWIAVINLVVLPVSTAVAEDSLYLGCGVNQIKNKWASIFVPAFFFALQHSFIPVLFDVKYILYRFLSFLPLTIILCIYYYKKRNPVPVIIGHAVIDLATAVQILMTSAIPGFYQMMTGL